MAESGQRYDLLEPIAAGGMGEVFRAEVRGAHGFVRPVAVKRIRPELARTPELLLRFVAEAKTSVSLVHANVVQVLDLCRAGEDLYIVMELVDGVDLGYLFSTLARRRQQIPIATVLYIAIEALKALSYAHERGGVGHGVVHCDISPSNLLISRSGEVKLTDFGIAQSLRRSAQGAGGAPIMGKLRYMAPEQLRGEAIDERADLYGLAVVLYESLTLKPLFMPRGERPDDEALVQAALHDVPPSASTIRADVPPALSALLDAALAKQAGARPRRARDMLQSVTRIVHEAGALVTAPEVGQWVTQLSEDRAARPALALEPTAAPGDAPRPPPRDPLREDATLDERRSARVAPAAPRPRTLTYTGRRSADGLLLLDVADATPAVEDLVVTPVEAGASRRRLARLLTAGALLAGVGLGANYLLRPSGAAAPPVAVPAAKPNAPAPPPPASPSPPTVAPLAPAPVPVKAADASATVASKPRAVRASAPAAEPKTGALNVYAEPWAQATLDGKSIGTTPIVDLRVPAGEHVLRLRNPSSRPFERRVRIRPGGRELVSVELEPQR